jgi:hypothetical protein
VWFDVLIFTVIMINTLMMASMNMREVHHSDSSTDAFEAASTILYTLEALIKIIDQGFAFAPGSYLDSGWNQFDFVLVLGTLVSLFESTMGNQFLALRAFRCFRPLRAMKNFRDGQLLMRTALAALPLLRDALIFLGWFMLVTSVTGTMLFGGKLTGRCVSSSAPPPPPATVNASSAFVATCPAEADVSAAGAVCDPQGRGYKCDAAMGEICCKSNHHPSDEFLSFDDFLRSAVIVLQIITIDGWNELAVDAADATGFGVVAPYFSIIVFFGGFYVLQLFTSVMIITLNHCANQMDEQDRKEEEREVVGIEGASDAQDDKMGVFVNWVGAEINRGLASAKKWVAPRDDGDGKRKLALSPSTLRLCRRLQKIVESSKTQQFILGVICLNTVTMAMDSYGQSEEYYAALYWCEFTFTCVFIVEFALKHVAYGPTWYWGNAWNVIDGVIVISGILELSMGSGADGVALLRMLRVLRIFAGLKGLRKYHAFQQVFAAVFNGVKRIASFCVVFFLFLTVFAILGMQLFGGIDGMSEKRSHFDTFGAAALTLFIICTGENTYSVGWDLMQASGINWSVIYVLIWSLVSTSLLALVLGVLIEAASAPVELEDLPEGNPLADDDGEEEKEVTSPRLGTRLNEEASPRDDSSTTSLQMFRSLKHEALSRVAEGTLNDEHKASEEEIRKAKEQLEIVQEQTKVEVAAVRLWLNEHGFDYKSRAVIRTNVVNGAVEQTVVTPGESAEDVRGRYTEKELADARERLVNPDGARETVSAVSFAGKGQINEKDEAIKFSIGSTTSNVTSVQEMLKRKAAHHEAILRDEQERKEIGVVEYERRAFLARAKEVGLDLERDKLRVWCLAFAEHRYTRNTVLFLIVVSACLLAPQCDKDWPREGSQAQLALKIVDYFFTSVFAIEMIVKLIAYTAYSGPCAYLKDNWNRLDGFIVAMSFVTIILSTVAADIGGVMKVFRVLRVLRPLRVIKNIPSLKLVIDATFVSLPSIMTVCCMGVVTFIILGVLGMSLFKGQFYSCSLPNEGGDKASCLALGGEWENPPVHFNNIGQSTVAIFMMSTGDNWQDIMWFGTDIAGVDKEPVQGNRMGTSFFFVAVIIIAFFFWANLFVSSLVDNFSQVAAQIKGEEDIGSGYNYSESQRRWLLALKAGMDAARDEWREENPLSMHPVRRFIFRVRKWRQWEKFVTIFITANAVQLCFIRTNSSEEEDNIMAILSNTFCVLYVLETLVNITALTWKVYWKNGWHRLDFTITTLGVLELIIMVSSASQQAGFVTVFRTARFFRLFKLLKSSPGLRSLVDTFITALPGMMNILGLMLLLMHIYACLGCTLYGSISGPYEGDGLTPYTNFENWGNAMSLLFVVMSGNWAEPFKDVYWSCATEIPDPVSGGYGGCPYRYSAVFYFFSFVILGIYLLANLFVAILLERFDYSSTMEGVYDENNPFDVLCRLNIIRHFVLKIQNRLRLVRALQEADERKRRSSLEVAPGRRSLDGKPAETSFRKSNQKLLGILSHGESVHKSLRLRVKALFAGRGMVSETTAEKIVDDVMRETDEARMAAAVAPAGEEDEKEEPRVGVFGRLGRVFSRAER